MSDGLTDMRSQSKHKCRKCNKEDYIDYFFSETLCLECYGKKYKYDTINNKTKNGIKFDNNKLQFSLIPPDIKLWLAEILTFGARKYAPDNWKKVEIKRYYDALERHLNAFQLGEVNDSESGFHHLKHALTNMMFICYLEINKGK